MNKENRSWVQQNWRCHKFPQVLKGWKWNGYPVTDLANQVKFKPSAEDGEGNKKQVNSQHTTQGRRGN